MRNKVGDGKNCMSSCMHDLSFIPPPRPVFAIVTTSVAPQSQSIQAGIIYIIQVRYVVPVHALTIICMARKIHV